MSEPLSVLFFGRRSVFSLRILEEVARTFKVVGVVESHFRGFKQENWVQQLIKPVPQEADIRRYAIEHSIPYFLLTPDRMDGLESFIADVKPNVGLIASLAQLLPAKIFSAFPRHILNAHPSFLPHYRGPNPYFWVYYHEEKFSGITLHYIDEGEDTGDIVRQERFPIGFGEPLRTVVGRAAEVGAALAVRVLNDIANGTSQRVVQKSLPCPFRARMLKLHENPIQWNAWTIERIYHVLRGAGPVDLIPRRPFPYHLLKWEAVGFQKCTTERDEAVFKRSGATFYIVLSSGRIRLKPKLSMEQAILSTKISLRPARAFLQRLVA